ncbi:hypothetical protein PAERUG_P1_London_28_IMP_1_04_05_03863 [Pseudomonas aeruginosa]|nr:hypothetical protein PAERUG_P1_London_28_IMP_1_04_05_03863 [Pseudomonas aeruginosa]CRQ26740.1 hypothetical protein PAERUG_P2_London_28_IMP_1_06_05_04792 [Pseudomonas aeruginosa]CRX25194.1 hypothetical protein PAERUG_P64_East_of_England_6_01_14_05595 [Pseudomonas aeruginosa]CRX26404.1 hypothetical protein PAERUG_P6_East_of_England_6_IMP_1_03_09_06268 [Pseudomonas aeruginosa]
MPKNTEFEESLTMTIKKIGSVAKIGGSQR